MKEHFGSLTTSLKENEKVAIVTADFNEMITERLTKGAISALKKSGLQDSQIEIFHVPGAFELPLIAKKLAAKEKIAGVIALGCVIKGETDHYDYVCSGVTNGIMRATLETQKPITFGVLTTDTLEQALQRSGAKVGNKGFSVAQGLIEMINTLKIIK